VEQGGEGQQRDVQTGRQDAAGPAQRDRTEEDGPQCAVDDDDPLGGHPSQPAAEEQGAQHAGSVYAATAAPTHSPVSEPGVSSMASHATATKLIPSPR
jgi:hypothetical protein